MGLFELHQRFKGHILNELRVPFQERHLQKQPAEVFCKKGILENLAHIGGKHLC